MPVISDIKKQKRSDIRFSVFVEGRYAFSLGDLELSTSGLRVGQQLTEDDVARYQDEASEAKAYALALRFLSFRPRSVREMRDYLRRKEVGEEDQEAVISRLLASKLLDDAAFAESWIRNRQALKPRSRRMLEQELAAKGVSRTDMEIAMTETETDSDGELDVLVGLLERKRRLPQYADSQKLMAFFARQGYSYDQLKKALERLAN